MRRPRAAARALVAAAGLALCSAAVADAAPEAELPELPPGFHSDVDEVSVAVGEYHACAIEYDDASEIGGPIRCWGSNAEGQATPPGGAFMQVSAGNMHSCALRLDQTVACWGRRQERFRSPPGLYVQVSCGFTHTCAVTVDAKLRCWGERGLGSNDAPDGRFVQVSSGRDHDCALRATGEAVCWGSDRNGRLDAPRGVLFKQVSASTAWNSCGVALEGDVRCWGGEREGRGEADDRAGRYKQVSAGRRHNCAIRAEDGRIECWGYLSPHLAAQGQGARVRGAAFDLISLGNTFACGVTMDSEVLCWGSRGTAGALDVPAGLYAA